MSDFSIKLTGQRSDVDAALIEIRELPEAEATYDDPQPVGGSIISRRPQNQIELVEVVVGLTLNLASSAIWDGLKSAVKAIAKRRNIESQEVEEDAE